MKQALIVIGAIILVASVFGFSYAEQQQSLTNQAEDFLEGSSMDWELLSALSLAGIPLGIIMLIAGLVPGKWYDKY